MTSVPPSQLIAPQAFSDDPEISVTPDSGMIALEDLPPSITINQSIMPAVPSNQVRPEGYILGAVMMIVMAVLFASVGAPGIMVVVVFVFALVSLAWYLVAKRQETERCFRQQMAASDAEQFLKNQISQAVKESLKGNIKVRCKYCGSLNDESAAKCESCGAGL